MPAKKKEESAIDTSLVAPQPGEPEIGPAPVPIDVTLQRSEALRRVIGTMRNGAASLNPNSSAHPFSPHPSFMNILNVAYRYRNQEEFLQKTKEYLEQAVMHVAQAGRREDIPGVIAELRELCNRKDVGFEAVALRILRVINAPV